MSAELSRARDVRQVEFKLLHITSDLQSQKHEAARALGAFKKNCHKITTEEVGKVVAISA
jgi:hypothetical protein